MKRGLVKDKFGQSTMGLPFGIIFALFLIVVFIVIAFIAVNYFLDIGKCASVGMFYEELQGEVNDVLVSQETDNVEFEVDLPSGIERVCFWDTGGDTTRTASVLEDYDKISIYQVQDANVFLIPPGKACEMQFKKIENINITEITSERNPYCVDAGRGLVLSKGFYDKFVVVV
tara:strand:+ start:1084 stop:1602 length:519 start_codon:yes stop_codon:yes gene_type:complete